MNATALLERPIEAVVCCEHCNAPMVQYESLCGSFSLLEMAIMPYYEVMEECSNPECISNNPPETPF
jgi:hypothetical protein